MGRIHWFVAVGLLTACGEPLTPAPEPFTATSEPFIKGVITAKDPYRGLLVEADRAGEHEVDAAVVRADRQTKVEPAGRGAVSWEGLAVGQTISVWITGPVLESLPVQVLAESVLIE